MATTTWQPKALAVQQVSLITMSGTWSAAETVTATINGKDLVLTLGSSVTNADVATALKEAWEDETFTDTTYSKSPDDGGQDYEEFKEATATVASAVVTLTADTAGVPFIVTVADDSGTGTATVLDDGTGASVLAAGPNFANDATNWDGGLPNGTDVIVLEDSSVSMLYGLDGVTGTQTSYTQWASFTGDVGLPEANAAGYIEYRNRYLELDCATVVIGRGPGNGSSLTKIVSDPGTLTTLDVESTGQSRDDFGAVIWKGITVNHIINVRSGSVSIAPHVGDAALIKTVQNTGGTLHISRNVTLAAANSISNQTGSILCEADAAQAVVTLTNESGTVETTNNVTTVTSEGGTVEIGGTATVTTLNLNGGTCDYRSSGTITTANIEGTFDASNDNRTRTISTTNIKPGGVIEDPKKTITYTPVLDSRVARLIAE